jgi:hypothetical protein
VASNYRLLPEVQNCENICTRKLMISSWGDSVMKNCDIGGGDSVHAIGGFNRGTTADQKLDCVRSSS